MNDIITEDGEVIEGALPALIDTTMAGALARVELDSQVATARQFPRSLKTTIDNILTLATLDEETATECVYAVKRGGKTLRGPSIRLAEIIASQWGNCRDSAAVVSIDRQNKMIIAEGTFHDLQTNRGTRATIQRRISDKHGRIYNDDMIAVTGNAACSIARRNAILAGVPKGVWRRALDAAEQILRGDAKTLTARRETAIKALAHFGLTADQVIGILDVKGIDDIDLNTMVDLRGMYSALKNGEVTADELLRGTKTEMQHKIVANPLADAEPAPQGAPQPAHDVQAQQDPEAHQQAPQQEETASQPDPIEHARRRGVAARAAGQLRKAIPGEYREPGREAEADAWRDGWDHGTPADA